MIWGFCPVWICRGSNPWTTTGCPTLMSSCTYCQEPVRWVWTFLFELLFFFLSLNCRSLLMFRPLCRHDSPTSGSASLKYTFKGQIRLHTARRTVLIQEKSEDTPNAHIDWPLLLAKTAKFSQMHIGIFTFSKSCYLMQILANKPTNSFMFLFNMSQRFLTRRSPPPIPPGRVNYQLPASLPLRPHKIYSVYLCCWPAVMQWCPEKEIYEH